MSAASATDLYKMQVTIVKPRTTDSVVFGSLVKAKVHEQFAVLERSRHESLVRSTESELTNRNIKSFSFLRRSESEPLGIPYSGTRVVQCSGTSAIRVQSSIVRIIYRSRIAIAKIEETNRRKKREETHLGTEPK